MKFPETQKTTVNIVINAVGTAGLLGIVLVVLIALGKISAWWSILAVAGVLSGMGREHILLMNRAKNSD
jgi:hypothetical protein